MKHFLLLFGFVIIPCIISSFIEQTGFLDEQLKNIRVKNAVEEKKDLLAQTLQKSGFSQTNINILIVAYKAESVLEVYVKEKTAQNYTQLLSYPICASSGILGPKRREGDLQVPEGFYHINHFNPVSNFHLSLGINYPNAADKLKSSFPKLGGSIYIHGSCVTIGCLPLTDDYIKELYVLSVYAKNNGQGKIPVYIFPFKMNEENMNLYLIKYSRNIVLTEFWKNLKTGYDSFTSTKRQLTFSTDTKGNYTY
ncbi:MAG: L,D-transpeptidase family protein [Bacteroidales bacterium]|nr:L,D-transpeptidase family protein [Bacteroidales bacterium]